MRGNRKIDDQAKQKHPNYLEAFSSPDFFFSTFISDWIDLVDKDPTFVIFF